ncbi:hypothetical protein [Xanthobacter sp. VNH20]|uniref:hypothetical protein n=1 Tax=Xanthobacter sp. VNH20 TaxID=3156616 RepID=UPI0032B46AF0
MAGTEQDDMSDISDAELFALGIAGRVEEAQAEPPEPPASEPEAPEPAERQQPAQADPPAPDHRVPLSELLNERERRQEFAREVERLRQENAEFQRQMQALRQPVQPPPDMFADPEGFRGSIEQQLTQMEQRFAQRIQRERLDMSFDLAAEKNPEGFQKAFSELEQVIKTERDYALRDRIVSAPNPGKALLDWHRNREALRETGGDVVAYRERISKEARESLAKDPEFRRQLLEEMRAEAGAARALSNPTQMPSLNRATAAAPNAGSEARDLSDGELFALGSRPRRRR